MPRQRSDSAGREYTNTAQLVRHADDAIIDRATRAAEQIAVTRQVSAGPPVSVERFRRAVKPRRNARVSRV